MAVDSGEAFDEVMPGVADNGSVEKSSVSQMATARTDVIGSKRDSRDLGWQPPCGTHFCLPTGCKAILKQNRLFSCARNILTRPGPQKRLQMDIAEMKKM